MAVADASLSTRCGAHGATIETAIARAVAAVGLSAVFFQDMFGLLTFDDKFEQLAAARPRIGRSHVIYCVDLYQNRRVTDAPSGPRDVVTAIEGHLRRAAVVPVISDFLFADAKRVVDELALVDAVHDVFLLMADVRFAYEMPRVSDGWIEAFDVETGRTGVFSRREMARLGRRATEWQDRRRAPRARRRASTSCGWGWTGGKWRRRSSSSRPSGGCGKRNDDSERSRIVSWSHRLCGRRAGGLLPAVRSWRSARPAPAARAATRPAPPRRAPRPRPAPPRRPGGRRADPLLVEDGSHGRQRGRDASRSC